MPISLNQYKKLLSIRQSPESPNNIRDLQDYSSIIPAPNQTNSFKRESMVGNTPKTNAFLSSSNTKNDKTNMVLTLSQLN